MKDFITAQSTYLLPHELLVSGHLPTGWGRFCLPAGVPTNGVYKTTPASPTHLPASTGQLQFWVYLYFADDLRVPAGTLYTHVPLHDHRHIEYRAAGVSSFVNIRPYAAALISEGEEASK